MHKDATRGNASYDPSTVTHMITYDTSKAARIFGMQYMSMMDSTRDIIEDFKSRGWVD